MYHRKWFIFENIRIECEKQESDHSVSLHVSGIAEKISLYKKLNIQKVMIHLNTTTVIA